MDNGKSYLLIISNDLIGQGNAELGNKLMTNFLITLSGIGKKLETIFLLNNGIKLAIEGSDLVDELSELEKRGCKILLCTTCVEFFDLVEKVKVGTLSNMKTLVESIEAAEKVVFI